MTADRLCARMRKNLQVSIRSRATTRVVCEGEAVARLIDIARAAGVSEATVSRVLNGKAGVNEATRQAVLEVARRLGRGPGDRKSTRLNSSHVAISYAVFCLKKKSRREQWPESYELGSILGPLVHTSARTR